MAHQTLFSDSRPSPKGLILLGLLVLVFCTVFLPVWQSLFHSWASSENDSQGFLIVPLSLYILWRKREQIGKTPFRSSWLGLPLVLTSLLLYLLSQLAKIITLGPLSMIAFLGSSVVFLFGTRVFKVCLFPLTLLLFMVPVPAQLYAAMTLPLQLFVTKVTVFFVSLMGVPILREGNVLHLPRHSLQVVQACSGLRSIMSLLTLGALFAYFTLRNNRLRVVLFFSGIPIAIAINVARIMAMVLALYYMGINLTEGTVHTVFGACLFGLAVVIFAFFRKGLSFCDK